MVRVGRWSLLFVLAVSGACSHRTTSTPAPADDADPPAPAPPPDARRAISLPPAPVRQLALGDNYAVALLTDGSVWSWGRTLDAPAVSPRPNVRPFTDIAAIAVADDMDTRYMCLVGATGTATCVGGRPSVEGWSDGWAEERGVKPGTTALAHVARMAVADRRVCALLDDGTVRCWSYNPGESATPRTVAGVKRAVQLVVGDFHGCALEQDASVWCWGDDETNVVGFGLDRPARRVAGLGHVTQLTGAGNHDCALVADGTVWCWGGGSSGELGAGATSSQSEPKAVPGLTDVVEIASGAYNSCARRRDGSVVCWGHAMTEPKLGTMYARAPAPIAGLDDAVQIAVGSYSACALRRDGEVACWGSNRDGQLGDGSGADQTLATVRW